MTSGRAGTTQWLLEYEPQSAPFIEPLMGWTGSTDPMAHLRLSFPSREAAVAYAERQGLEYAVREPRESTKARITGARPQGEAMPVWRSMLPDSAWSNVLVPEIGETDVAAILAA
jgi:ETC complex I subunit conserved region